MGFALSNRETGPSTEENALAEAVARNSPVEIFRTDSIDDAPPGRGRLLELREDVLVLEKVQVIGRDVAFVTGSIVECYFSFKGQLFQFRSKVTETGVPFKLNDQFVVSGMTVERPKEVKVGQRRRSFRVSLAGQDPPIMMDLWFARSAQAGLDQARAAYQDAERTRDQQLKANPRAKPISLPPKPTILSAVDYAPPDYEAQVVEASDMGLSAAIDRCSYTRFKHLDTLLIRIGLPQPGNVLVFKTEVRHARELREGSTRVGLMMLEEPNAAQAFQANRRKLVAFLQEVQRAARR